MQAYGWSLPAKPMEAASSTVGSHSQMGPNEGAGSSTGSSGANTSSGRSSHVPVPVPVYCRPLMEKEPGMKVNSDHNRK